MRILFLGDIVGRPGRHAVTDRLPGLRERWRLDCVVINGENAAGGFGITESICDEILQAGADAVTLGNHSFDQREALVFIERAPELLRPVNYPPGTPGRGVGIYPTPSGAQASNSARTCSVLTTAPTAALLKGLIWAEAPADRAQAAIKKIADRRRGKFMVLV